MKNAIEYLLFRSNISNYQISKATGISAVVLGKYTTGKSEVGHMKLDNAEKIYHYFKEVLTMYENKYGTVEFEGKTYTLVEQAGIGYISKPYGSDAWLQGDFYRAHAIDNEGKEYLVLWSPVEGWKEMEDGADHCDWDHPDYVIKV